MSLSSAQPCTKTRGLPLPQSLKKSGVASRASMKVCMRQRYGQPFQWSTTYQVLFALECFSRPGQSGSMPTRTRDVPHDRQSSRAASLGERRAIGEYLRSWRTRRHLTQMELALRAEIYRAISASSGTVELPPAARSSCGSPRSSMCRCASETPGSWRPAMLPASANGRSMTPRSPPCVGPSRQRSRRTGRSPPSRSIATGT